MNRPFNHVALELEADTDERTLTRCMSALVDAWQPDHLGAVTQGVKRAQGQRPPEVSIGRLTYVRDGTPLDRSALGDQIDVAEADGGLYIVSRALPRTLALKTSTECVTRWAIPSPRERNRTDRSAICCGGAVSARPFLELRPLFDRAEW
jgi:hypothetical protein